MAFRKLYDLPQGFNQPSGMGSPPSPAFNPMGGQTTYGGGMTTKYAAPVQPRFGATGGTVQGQARLPRIPTGQELGPKTPGTKPSAYQPPKVSPFLWNMFGSMKTMDVDQRSDYLQNLAAGIKDRLDQYGLRLARGRALTPEQQARYDSLRSSFSDIQGYMTNQTAYDDYMTKLGEQTPEQYAARQQEDISRYRKLGGYWQ